MIYSGASDIWTPDIWTLQFTDDFILEQIFLCAILSHLSGIPRCGSGRSDFTTKHCYDDTPFNTIERLHLSIEFNPFLYARSS